MAYLSQLTTNRILLRAPNGSFSQSGDLNMSFSLESQKWSVYPLKITFCAKFAEMDGREEEEEEEALMSTLGL